MTLDELRVKIDEIDNRLLELFNERMELVHKVGELKNTTNSPIYRPEREQSILNRLKKNNGGKLTNQAIDASSRAILGSGNMGETRRGVAF